jgi:hypothetical protein
MFSFVVDSTNHFFLSNLFHPDLSIKNEVEMPTTRKVIGSWLRFFATIGFFMILLVK